MSKGTVYANGDSVILTVPLLSKIALYTAGTASYALQVAAANNPAVIGTPVQWANGQIVLGTYSVPQGIQIYAGAYPVYWEIATNPNASMPYVVQKAQVAKTTSATLTPLELWQGALTVNQGGAGASVLTLPLAADMDTQFSDAIAQDGFDFSVTNISTVAAEDASVATNTGWTLVGNMDVASNAAATDKSAGLFRVWKTAAGAWTCLRRS